jgi:O-antigen ligase
VSDAERFPRDRILPAASVLAAASGAATAALGVTAIPIGLSPLLLFLLVRYSTARLTWYVGGALLVFGGTDVGGPKVAYLGGTVLVFVISLARVERSDAEWMQAWRPVIPATAVMLALIAVSFLAGRASGATSMVWVRDAMPYALLGLSPVIALDAAHDVSEKILYRVIGGVGLLAAIGTTASWLDHRGISSLPFGQFILATGMPAVLGMCAGLAHVAGRQHVARWLLLTISIPMIMVTSGGRTIVTWSTAVLGMIGARARARMSVGKAIVFTAIAGLILWRLSPLLAGVIGDRAFFDSRVQMAMRFMDNAEGDQSFQGRQMAYRTGMDLWEQHRWWGAGPGAIGSLDSPVMTLAKFGVAGTTLIVGFVVLLLWCGYRSARTYGWSMAHTMVRCWVIVVVAGIAFGPRLEDKGFALTTALAVCALAVAAREGSAPREEAGARDSTASAPLAAAGRVR